MKQIREFSLFIFYAAFIGILVASLPIRAEYLIIKKTEQGLVPLDTSDEPHAEAIIKILFDYQWPMVVANLSMTRQEQEELLTAGQPNGEEEFLRKKIKEINPNYDVIFIPTTIYELFALADVNKKGDDSVLQEAHSNTHLLPWVTLSAIPRRTKDQFLKELSALPRVDSATLSDDEVNKIVFDPQFIREYSEKIKPISVNEINDFNIHVRRSIISNIYILPKRFEKIKKAFSTFGGDRFFFSYDPAFKLAENLLKPWLHESNDNFGSFSNLSVLHVVPGASFAAWHKEMIDVFERHFLPCKNLNRTFYKIAFFALNHDIASMYFSWFKNRNDINELSSLIKRSSYPTAAYLLTHGNFRKEIVEREIESENQRLNANGIIARVIQLEYAARSQNTTLFFRGSSPIPFHKREGEEPLQLMGSTMYETELLGDIAEQYKKGKNQPYSISFGNSLFAGYFEDFGELEKEEKGKLGACAYPFLAKNGGYALFIDKKEAIQHRTSSMFYYSPMATMAALYAMGEWFHPRTKFVRWTKQEEEEEDALESGKFTRDEIEELEGWGSSGAFVDLVDPLGIVSTKRDPLEFAARFSNYLARNMRVVSIGDESNLSYEERRWYEQKMGDFRQAQAEAGKAYKAVRTIRKALQKYPENPQATIKAMRESRLLKQAERKQQQDVQTQ